ncbi:MAG TPA: hypothetical protein DD379_18410 [Cyanobacteria bacterium UBA11162]|nr:hypothetical protein [Cyanobacteria bacterium UBA11162]
MEQFFVTAIALAILTYFYTWLVRTIDRFEKKPVPSLIAALAWGGVSVIVFSLILHPIFSLPMTSIFGQQIPGSKFIQATISTPITEEIIKGFAVTIMYLKYRRQFEGWVDGIIYGAMVGFGFAYVENIVDLLNTSSWQEWGIVFSLRVVVFTGLHGFWSALIGIGFGFACYTSNPFQKIIRIFSGLIAGMLSHSLHNGTVHFLDNADSLMAVANERMWLVGLFNYTALILSIVVVWSVAGYIDQQRLRIYLREEVPDSLSTECYEALCKPRSNALAALGMSSQQRRALFQVGVELAQKKLQLSKIGEQGGSSIEIARLREELRRLGNGDWGVATERRSF